VTPADLAKYDRIILSGRRKNDPAINAANSKIIRSCHETGQPLLGICYGSEIIALTLGGSLRRMPRHVQGPITIEPRRNPLTLDKKQVTVYESHGYCVAKLPPEFEALAGSQDCHHEIFAHEKKKIFGTQFHPEKSGADGLEIIANFVRV
jgi:GMP synthase (glutamine-hydrolysing)